MPRRFGSTPFADILPQNLAADAAIAAAAQALDEPLAKSGQAIPGLLIYDRLAQAGSDRLLPPLRRLGQIEPLSGLLLDLLAWQFHVDGYEAAASHEARRALIFQSLLLHRRKGTPWAVKNALATAFQLPCDLAEWFEYGGRPYFFRVGLDITGVFWPEQSTLDALRLIFEYKNARSWLDWLETRSRTGLERIIAVGALGYDTAQTRLHFPLYQPPGLAQTRVLGLIRFVEDRLCLRFPVGSPGLRKVMGLGLANISRTRMRLYFPQARPVRHDRTVALGLRALTRTRLGLRGKTRSGFARH